MNTTINGLASYSIESPESKHQCSSGTRSKIYRSPLSPSELITNFQLNPLANSWELFKLGCDGARKEFCLGTRVDENGNLGCYKWKSHDQVKAAALQCGGFITNNEICVNTHYPTERCSAARDMRVMGILMHNCPEWLIAEQAANAYGISLCPLYESFGPDSMNFILDQTKMSLLIISEKKMGATENWLLRSPYLKTVIVVRDRKVNSEYEISMKRWAQQYRQRFLRWDDMFEDGKIINEPPLVESSTIQTICYTSGTTGNPKGVLLSHKNMIANLTSLIRGPFQMPEFAFKQHDIHLCYLPLAHILERASCTLLLAHGASIGFASGDMLRLFEDMQELKPTLFTAVPRILNRLDQKIMSSVKKKPILSRAVFSVALNQKQANLRATGTVEHMLWDALIFNKLKQLVGGKVRFLLTGGASIDLGVEERVQMYFSAPLVQGYGMTECMGAALFSLPKDPVKGHVGGPCPWAEVCLESLPEMDYDALGPTPRGELLLKGPSLFNGYFLAPDLTDTAIDSDGWFHTGDIAERLSSGAFRILDRKKNIFKLAHGEYIAPEKIENIYGQASLISQIFVDGRSLENYLVALIVPDIEAGQKWWDSNFNTNVKVNYEDLILLKEFKDAVLKEMKDVEERHLAGFERVKKIGFASEPFSLENGLLTPTMKLKRQIASKLFGNHITKLYSSD